LKKTRLQHYLYIEHTHNLLFEFLDILRYCEENNKILTENIISDTLYNVLKKVGGKLGFKIKRTDSIFTYLTKAEEGLDELVMYLTLFIMSHSSEERNELKQNIKDLLNRINKKELTNLLLLLDKSFFGFSSMLRNLLIGVFGVEITTYKRWEPDMEFINDKIKEIRKALMRTNPTEDEIDALNKFQELINKANENIAEEVVTGAASGATTTDNVEKFWPKMGPTTRRRKRKSLKNLI
jgi:hypothetical protein